MAPNRSLKISRYYWPAISWAVVILLIKLVPGTTIPVESPWDLPVDKAVHFLMFAFLCLLLAGNRVKERGRLDKKFMVLAVTFAIVYGLLLEIGQKFIPYRDFSWWDFAADSAGAWLGTWGYPSLLKLKAKLVKR